MSHKLILFISYRGTRYCGWQVQPGSRPSIQSALEEALCRLTSKTSPSSGTSPRAFSSGRTDQGVHARIQVVEILPPKNSTHQDPTIQKLVSLAKTSVFQPGVGRNSKLDIALNALLPKDIRVLKSSLLPPQFRVLKSVEKKCYVYFLGLNFQDFGEWKQAYQRSLAIGFHNRASQKRGTPIVTSGLPNFVWHEFEWSLTRPIDLEFLSALAKLVKGKRDFSLFCGKGAKVSSKIRTVHAAKFGRLPPTCEETIGLSSSTRIAFRIVGHGFLKNMVRLLVGRMAALATLDSVEEIDPQAFNENESQWRLHPDLKQKRLQIFERELSLPGLLTKKLECDSRSPNSLARDLQYRQAMTERTLAPPEGLWLWDVSYPRHFFCRK